MEKETFGEGKELYSWKYHEQLTEEEKEKKQEWEESFQENLIKWQNKLLKLKDKGDQEKIFQSRREDKEFFEKFEELIYNAPKEFKFMIFDVSFTSQDIEEWNVSERIEEKWKIQPYYSESKGKKYQIPLISPRRVDWSKSGFTEEEILHRGSRVREWQATHPDLKTIEIDCSLPDKVTKQSTVIRLRPFTQSISLVERIPLFPRNLEKITLTKEPPFYLNSEEKEFIDEWYEKEIKE